MDGRSSRGSAAPRALGLLVLFLAACSASRRGIEHPVSPGENLFRIGKAYGVDYRELARVNGIDDPSRIEVGQKVFIPGATRLLPVTLITPRTVELSPRERPAPGDGRFLWPLREGTLVSLFGPRNGAFHDGIDLAAPVGTPVYASSAGRVVYSDSLRGYGNVVIVSHGADWTTVYAHNVKNEVSEGDTLAQGALVARVGESGRATGPNLHFEIRYRNAATNPIPYLPRR
jgi:lipoprotein NlpD